MRTAVEHIMGTAISLAAPDSVDAGLFRTSARAAFAVLRRADRVFSPFDPDSPVSRMRDGRLGADALADHPDAGELREVIELCDALHRASGGAFDAWSVGDPPGFDPCGAVKGWAAERASALLAERGLTRHALNAGGDVRLRGGGTGEAAPWRVGVVDPRRKRGLLTVLEIHDGAVATSGRTERGAHIWDPVAGRPATALTQVTVTGPDLALADGYATAAMAQPTRERAHAWLDALAAATPYQSITVDNGGHVRTTAGLAGSVLPDPEPVAAPSGYGRGTTA